MTRKPLHTRMFADETQVTRLARVEATEHDVLERVEIVQTAPWTPWTNLTLTLKWKILYYYDPELKGCL